MPGLTWRQSQLAWLGFLPGAEARGDPLTRPVDPETRALAGRLLGLGGTEVVVPFDDWWASGLILGCGRAAGPDGLTRLKGRPNSCHANSAAAWKAEPGRYWIQTGFGLSGGGWRRHTWLVDSEGRVVETTVPRDLYFGMVLNGHLSLYFCGLTLMPELTGGRRGKARGAKGPSSASGSHSEGQR
ncbi:MAG: hypothetical protein U0797_26260 [Gemmataceae bacterium]